MSQILNKIRDVDPNNSEAVKDAVALFFQNLPKYTDVNCQQWLRCLVDVINRFPKYCMSHRNTIETHLCHFLDSTNYYNVIEAAKCALALQQVRPANEKTATPKTCWRDFMSSLCSAGHTLIDALYPHVVDIYKQSEKQDQNISSSPLYVALKNINKTSKTNNMNKTQLMTMRLRNVLVYIQAMLVEVYPVAKPIRPQSILDLIVRTLSVTSGLIPANLSTDDVVTIKIQALRSLDALVACLGPNLIPFSPLIIRFLMQTLKWTSEHPSEESSKVRISAYNSLTRWLTTLQSHRASPDRSRNWIDELTTHVIDDVTPKKKIVELTMGSHQSKHLSKKAKRKLANTMLQESSMAVHMPGEKHKVGFSEEVNDDVAIASLECAETFLVVCGMFLNQSIHKRFQECLVRECYSLSSYSTARALCLLRALDACRKSAPPGVPPPTQYCLQLYSEKINSTHAEISTFCSRALLDIRLHLHCSPPSLNFSIQPPLEKKSDANKKINTERNRAALDALLGSGKVPQEEEKEEEPISVDEPSSKRARVEENTDNISVSSDSVDPIEVSDDSEEEIDTTDNVEIIVEKIQEIETAVVDDVKEILIDESETMKIIVEEADEVEEPEKEIIIEEKVTTVTAETENKIQGDEIDSTDERNIYEASTQLPANMSMDTMDEEERPLSMEVGYDYPNTGTEKVPVLERIEDENLPSTNETDDIQITCGQVVKNSQEVDDKKSVDDKTGTPKVNGFGSPQKVIQDEIDAANNNNKEVNKVEGPKDLTVEDMLADFVDEVNEDTQVTQV